MRKISLILFIALISYITVHGQRLINSADYPIQKIRVVIEQAQGGTVSENIRGLKYILLKGNKNNLVDFISDFKVSNDRIGVIGSVSSGGSFYVYDKEGELLKKVNKNDTGIHKDNSGVFYKIDKEGEDFKLTSGNLVSQYLFSKNGDFLDTVKTNYLAGLPPKYLRLNDKSHFEYKGPFYWNGRKDNNVLLLNDSALIKFNSQDTNTTYYSMSEGFFKLNEEIAYLSIAQKNQIYELDNTGVKQIYDFSFPMNNTLREEDKLKFKNMNDLINYLSDHSSKIIEIGRVVRFKNYLIFSVILGSGPNWLAYDVASKNIYNLSNIVPDKSNDYLSFLSNNYLATDGEFLYSIIYPQDIRSAINKSESEKHTMHKSYLDLQKSNNPLLVKFQLNL
ncbi:6-bladed beta-propeller [Sphingobacterium ginsenosidimutans]|uniref:6-bladed beta-propeller n=1 Tax=Sphingobacterium ginsenosidimutans TaxID=687845 RepID=A0ABP7ZRD4_9SPHI